MANPDLSVVMPVYNDGPYLNEAIDSIIGQSFSNFEFIIINDGSTDNSLEIIKSYRDPRIILLQNKSNQGIAKALNLGMEQVKGKYVARMDGNDVAYIERFELQKNILDNHENIGLVTCNSKVVNDKGEFLYNHVKNIDPDDSQVYIFFKNYTAHSTVMIRKSILPTPVYDEQCAAEDYALWIKLARNSKFFVINKFLMKVRLKKKGLNETNIHNMIKSQRTIIKNTLNSIGKNYTDYDINYHMNHGKHNRYSIYDAARILYYYEKLYNNNLVKKYFSEPVFSDYLYRYYYHVLIKTKKVNYRLLSQIFTSKLTYKEKKDYGLISIKIIKKIIFSMVHPGKETTIHVIGDSHAKLPWQSINLPNVVIRSHVLGPKLMYTIGMDEQWINIESYNIKHGDIIIFCFGEIDCRCHVWKFKQFGYKNIIDDLVDKYFNSITNNVAKLKNVKICVYNIVPPVKREEHKHNEVLDYPFLGTDQERKTYVGYMNNKLEEKCGENNYLFINVYNNYCNDEGYLNYKLSDKNIHIGDPYHIIKIIKNII